jgi:hypothetical protein
LRIPESKIRVILALLTPPLLLGLAILTLTVKSPISVPIVFGILGTILGVIVLFDFPLALQTTDEGLTRVCLVRHHHVAWSDISVIIKPKRRGLLLITTRRKRYVLVDRLLEGSERNHLMDLGEIHGFQVEI